MPDRRTMYDDRRLSALDEERALQFLREKWQEIGQDVIDAQTYCNAEPNREEHADCLVDHVWGNEELPESWRHLDHSAQIELALNVL